MIGPLALVGSGEFLAVTESIDRALVDFEAGPERRRVAVLPTAAGPEGAGSVDRWLDLGVSHFERLGADAIPLRVVDRATADDEGAVAEIGRADLIYFSGGDPLHVTESMRGSQVWRAVVRAWSTGTALAGCSAGAMMLGSVTASPRVEGLRPGLGLLGDLCVLPHFDRLESFRPGLAAATAAAVPPGTQVIGVDETTGLVFDGAAWSVVGSGRVTVFDDEAQTEFAAGETVPVEMRFRTSSD